MPQDRPEIEFEPFVERVVTDPADVPATFVLVGYLGAASRPEVARVYTTHTLSHWFEVRLADILHTERASSGEPLRPSIVWVKDTANLSEHALGVSGPFA